MKYQPLLSEAKKFLIDTRIIEWCSKCKGFCCGGIKCQSLNDCNNRVLCKIHICSGLLEYLFCGKDANDYQKAFNYINGEINKRLMVEDKRIKQPQCFITVKHNAWSYPYSKEMDEIDFDDAKIKFIFKTNREKISQKMEILLSNGDNLQCSKRNMEDQCWQCTKVLQCALYCVKKERQKELAGQKSLFT